MYREIRIPDGEDTHHGNVVTWSRPSSLSLDEEDLVMRTRCSPRDLCLASGIRKNEYGGPYVGYVILTRSRPYKSWNDEDPISNMGYSPPTHLLPLVSGEPGQMLLILKTLDFDPVIL